MTDNRSFSAIVDNLLGQSRHPGRKVDMTRYLNATMRELDITGLYRRSLVEDTLTADAAPFIWTPPVTLRKVRTVYYANYGIYPKFQRPGKRIQEERLQHYYYAASTYYAFAGVLSGDFVDVAYYTKPRLFVYYDVGSRPATWSEEDQAWTYLNSGTDAENEAARDKVTHWLLEDWAHVAEEGTLAKFFKQFNDERAGSTFAVFSQFKKDLMDGEETESFGE